MIVKFYDTNALLFLQEEAFNKGTFAISDVTLKELETIKTSANKSDEIKHKARKLASLLDKYNNDFEVSICTDNIINKYGYDTPDMRIIACAIEYRNYVAESGDDVVFVSDDICCKNLARAFDLTVESTSASIAVYKGYKEFVGTSEEINAYIETATEKEKWYTNEYLLIENTELGSRFEMRYDGNEFVPLKLPPTKIIKAKNPLQRCALDILCNPKITIAAILGGYGSGKTFLSMRMALYAIREKGWQSKILGVREVVGEGRQIGYLPGDKEDKLSSFFLPLTQQLENGEYELESLKRQGVLEVNSPYFLKGTTYNQTIILVDEAEDLSEKQIKLVGTRVGENSKIIFAGDYKQSVIDASENNGLVKMCNSFIGNDNFACIYLGEDVRSDTSKMFADLFSKE